MVCIQSFIHVSHTFTKPIHPSIHGTARSRSQHMHGRHDRQTSRSRQGKTPRRACRRLQRQTNLIFHRPLPATPAAHPPLPSLAKQADYDQGEREGGREGQEKHVKPAVCLSVYHVYIHTAQSPPATVDDRGGHVRCVLSHRMHLACLPACLSGAYGVEWCE